MEKVAVLAAVILIFGASTGAAKDTPLIDTPNTRQTPEDTWTRGTDLHLDMVTTSVDDMYSGCKDKMEQMVKTKFLQIEKNRDKNIKLAWKAAEEFYENYEGKSSSALGKEQMLAIHMYTLDKPKIFSALNSAVRTQKYKYKTTFRFHTLHFFLTTAIQTLNLQKTHSKRCVTVFRRVNEYFSVHSLNKEIRFGSFASATMGRYPNYKRFGSKSCFEIRTCFGASISRYSKYEKDEKEVLIPPYEIFKVTKVEKKSLKKKLPCELVFHLNSTEKTMSSLNCSLF